MSTGTKKAGRRGAVGITAMQQRFVDAFVQERNATAAAAKAGYADPNKHGCQLLEPERYPLIVREVERRLAILAEQTVLKAEEVRRYIHTVLQFSPLDHFQPGYGGGWLIDRADFDKLPRHVKQLVEEVQLKVTTKEVTDPKTGKVTKVKVEVAWVRLVSKTVAMTLAAKYALTERKTVDSNLNVNAVSWDSLAAKIPEGGVPDMVEVAVKDGIPRLENGLKELAASGNGIEVVIPDTNKEGF